MSALTKEGAKSEKNEFLYSKSVEEKPILSKEYDKEAFILNYQLNYKKENIKRLTEERKSLENDFKTSCKMKEQLHNELQNVVGTEMKHWLQYQEDCEAEEKQIAFQLEEARRRKCNLVEVAQIHLQEMEDILKNTKQMLSEKEERIEKYQTYIRFTYKQLQDKILILQDTMKLIASNFVDDRAFIKMCMEQSQHLLNRRTHSDVETIKIETLNLGIENLTSDKWKDLLEEERLHYELNIQAAEVKRLTHSLTTIVKLSEATTSNLHELELHLWGLIFLPNWPVTLTECGTERSGPLLAYVSKTTHTETLLPFEQQFRVPQSLETVLHNYPKLIPVPENEERIEQFSINTNRSSIKQRQKKISCTPYIISKVTHEKLNYNPRSH